MFTPGAPLLGAQLNSDFFGAWYEFLRLEGLLNATGAGAYACGPCVTSVATDASVAASIGAQTSGVGTQLTIGLAHGDYTDLTNAQTITGAKTFSNGLTVSSGNLAATTQVCAGPCFGSANGDITANRGGSGVIFLGTATNYLFYNGTNYTLNRAPVVASSDTVTNTYLAPVYAANGSTTTSTMHSVFASCTFAVAQACGPITLSGAAAFSSKTSYACGVSDDGTTRAAGATWALNVSGNQVTLESTNSTSDTMTIICTGT